MTCKMSSNRSDLAAHYSGHAAALVGSTPTSIPRHSQIFCWSSHKTQRHKCLFWDAHRQISDSVMFCLSDCMPACTWTPACSELPLSIISDLDWFQRLHREFKRQPELMRLNDILHFIFWPVHFDDSTVWKQCRASSAFKWRWGLWRYWLLQSSAYSTVLDIP